MALLFRRNTKTIKEIYDAFQAEQLIVDPTYQRRKVWLPQDKIRLIETILLDLVIPEVFFWPATVAADTGETLTHIVDGQQRIASIVDFVSNQGGFELSSKFLMDDGIKERCGDKSFVDLDNNDKEKIWIYDLSIVNIDKSFKINTIKQMFYRLNLTNYNLNTQEKLKSIESVFGDSSEALSKLDFWKESKVFSAADARRMLDVRYCCSIYILANEGIIDQTGNKKIDDYYRDYSDFFDVNNNLYLKIESAIDVIIKLRDKSTAGFISKKAQMYTLFCLVFKMFDNQKVYTVEVFERFKLFVKTYNRFRNDYDIEFPNDKLRKINEDIKRYKLASSEGINKINNRVIRLEVLYKTIIEFDDEIKNHLIELESIYLKQTDSNIITFEAFDDEDLSDSNYVDLS